MNRAWPQKVFSSVKHQPHWIFVFHKRSYHRRHSSMCKSSSCTLFPPFTPSEQVHSLPDNPRSPLPVLLCLGANSREWLPSLCWPRLPVLPVWLSPHKSYGFLFTWEGNNRGLPCLPVSFTSLLEPTNFGCKLHCKTKTVSSKVFGRL